MSYAIKIRNAFGYLYHLELMSLIGLAKKLPKNPTIVNIGAGSGTSGLVFRETRPDAVLCTVDIQSESSPYGSLEGERNAFREAGFIKDLNKTWFQMAGDSKEIGAIWRQVRPAVLASHEIHLLFIDGDHTYAGCYGDIIRWLPHVAHRGIVAVHDYKKAENDPTHNGRTKPYPGVDEAVDELLTPYYAVADHVDTLIAFYIDKE